MITAILSISGGIITYLACAWRQSILDNEALELDFKQSQADLAKASTCIQELALRLPERTEDPKKYAARFFELYKYNSGGSYHPFPDDQKYKIEIMLD